MAGQTQNDQLKHTFSSYVRIRCSGERGSEVSVLAALHDDEDDNDDDDDDLTLRKGDNGIYSFTMNIILNVNVITRREFKLASYDVTFEH